jgi:hypothetical protein
MTKKSLNMGFFEENMALRENKPLITDLHNKPVM